jgi:hypothetical protein
MQMDQIATSSAQYILEATTVENSRPYSRLAFVTVRAADLQARALQITNRLTPQLTLRDYAALSRGAHAQRSFAHRRQRYPLGDV